MSKLDQACQTIETSFCMPASLLHEVPQLAGYISPTSLANLLACNQELRRTVHGLVRKVTVANEQDIYFLSKAHWPQLVVVHVSEEVFCGFFWPSNSKLELLARIDVMQHDSNSTAFIVRTRQSAASTSPAQSHACQQQFAHSTSILSSPPCQQQLAATTLASPTIQPITSLRQQSVWVLAQCLLLLAFCPILIFFFPLLIFAVLLLLCISFWVGIVILLNQCWGPERKTLVQASETAVSSLALSADRFSPQDDDDDNGEHDKDMIPANLTAAAHKLAIQISRSNEKQITAEDAEELPLTLPKHAIEMVTAILPYVQSLRLCTKLDDASIAGLLEGPFFKLDYVYLSRSALGLRSVSALVQTSQLRSVSLSNCNLDDKAVQKLLSASWPNLLGLDLSRNAIGTAGVTYLAECKWQKLSRLNLQETDMDCLAVANLMNGDWPRLCILTLDISSACSGVFELLSLDFDSADTSTSLSLLVPRNNTYDGYDFPEQPPDMLTWPKLNHVAFC